jgi:hypothetical protein
MLQFSLGDATCGQQAHERRAGPQGPRWKRPQGCFDSHRIPITERPAVLLEQGNEPVPVLGLACLIDHVEGIGIRSGNKRFNAPATQVPQPPVAKLQPELPQQKATH